ncbi:uncharacterized protein LOC121878023 [Homarus americanus]|uniref:uncharacterized protein LOC121878023 n=1 Tax=Homarus americanus TaxID=6706 RepID=UPI001C46180D|nr:uncharacterized protein LOC121878023 [Homarus americanus]
MIVLAKNGYQIRERRWAPKSLGRVGVLVVTAQVLVGVMGVTLAAWFLMWAPSLKFREVPHYAGVPVFLAGVFGAILISCFQRRRHRSIANILKGVVVALCCISVVTCLCVCIFTALHLTQLASMTCHTQHTALLHPSTGTGVHLAAMKGSQQYGLTTPIPVKVPTSRQYMEGIEDDEDESEGSGREARDLPHDDDVDEAFEFETVTLATVAAGRENDIVLNVTFCECEKRGPTWVRMLQYPNLSCLEVNNILPVLFVASCVVTAVGALLSGLILYLLWSLKNSFYGATKPHETRPFIFTSNLKNNNKASNGSGSKVSNGDSQFR